MENLYDKLEEYSKNDYCPMHMPGHKRNVELLGSKLPYNIDITEIDGFDDLHNPKGIIKEIESSYIVIDNHGIGYLIYTANPYQFHEEEEVKIYVYQQIREDENTLYGFKTKEEKDLFLQLIQVKGLGCKMALPMFATGSSDGIIDAIERENILYLKKFPKIGDKLARQIILDLKGKLNVNDNNI